jgi:type II secretory pathway pseudopilin PulG
MAGGMSTTNQGCDGDSTSPHRERNQDARRDPVGEQNGVARRDRGSSLLEILVSIVLLGTVVAALVTAVLAMVQASSTVFEAARVETVLLNAGDQVDRARQQCNYDTVVQAAALAEGWPADQITVTVEILQSNTGNDAADWVPQDCGTALQPFDVQRLTISADHPTQPITRTLTVVKSDVN